MKFNALVSTADSVYKSQNTSKDGTYRFFDEFKMNLTIYYVFIGGFSTV
jgi:hypothetical protein